MKLSAEQVYKNTFNLHRHLIIFFDMTAIVWTLLAMGFILFSQVHQYHDDMSLPLILKLPMLWFGFITLFIYLPFIVILFFSGFENLYRKIHHSVFLDIFVVKRCNQLYTQIEAEMIQLHDLRSKLNYQKLNDTQRSKILQEIQQLIKVVNDQKDESSKIFSFFGRQFFMSRLDLKMTEKLV